MDSEDSDNTNFVSGNISPGWNDRSKAGGTKLFFCYFPSDDNSTYRLPDLGYPYGVLSRQKSVSNLTTGLTGFIFSDDEDNDPNNHMTFPQSLSVEAFANTSDIWWTNQLVIARISELPIYQNRNTEMFIIKVDD